MPYLHLKFMSYGSCHGTFRFPHGHAASFSLKIILSEANNFFFSQEYQLLEKDSEST